ncbi:MAG: hypothetical protein B7Z80_10525 [Rhodospirillales bacterium 20-64-7]|nr:MAG: hypothetical protein B7Z80_10525 [Rhodospirillales bacterium 20-64-7]HQT77076.1 hypothetical protein [Rhodopila sp.]
MALLDDLAKSPTPVGLAVGFGAALLVPMLMPAVTRGLRPAAKAAMRSGIMLYRSTVEPISAAVGNLVTEAQLELASARSAEATQPAEDRKTPQSKGRKGQAAKHP